MAGTKGEKIVSILCGWWVSPVKEGVWPADFRNHVQYANDVMPKEKREDALVVGVYLRDGSVWLLIKNGLDNKLAEVPAVGWKATRGP